MAHKSQTKSVGFLNYVQGPTRTCRDTAAPPDARASPAMKSPWWGWDIPQDIVICVIASFFHHSVTVTV
jgi:hypothetical protein